MHIKKYLSNWSSHSIRAYLIVMMLTFSSFIFNQHMPTHAQTTISTIVTDSCNITDSSAYLWGVVYYRGTAIHGVSISLNVNGEIAEATTEPGDALPTYCISNAAIGEVAEITAKFAGQRVTRSVRISPGSDQKQQVNIVIPKRSIWDLWRVNTEINILKATKDDQFVIAGGQTGVIWLHKDTMQGSSLRNLIGTIDVNDTHIPGLDKTIRDIAIHNNGLVWAITDEGLFHQQNIEENSWVKESVPITGILNTLAINRDNGMVWVGGGESQREIACYLDGEWSYAYTTDGDIREMTIDSQNNLWVGTWGSGVYKYDNQEWFHYQTDDGLASNYIHTIMAMVRKDRSEILWFGTGHGVDSENTQSGVGSYDITNNEWRTYGVEQGLPEKPNTAGVAEDVYVFTVDEDGIVWAGTERGLYLLGNNMPGQERWILHDEQINRHVSALVAFNKTIVVATQNGLYRLVDNPELSSFDSIRLQSAKKSEGLLRLQVDTTTLASESTYAVWEWSSNHNGPLCTTSEACLFPTDKLKTGRHEIELRVQNEIGGRATSETLHVTIGHEVYLPTIRNRGQSPISWY